MAMLKTQIVAGRQWFTPVILATQEAEIRRITVRSQPGKIVRETLSQKKKNHKKGLVQNVGPEFKPQYHKKKKKNLKLWLNEDKLCEIHVHGERRIGQTPEIPVIDFPLFSSLQDQARTIAWQSTSMSLIPAGPYKILREDPANVPISQMAK
jgi:hypothetical protein